MAHLQEKTYIYLFFGRKRPAIRGSRAHNRALYFRKRALELVANLRKEPCGILFFSFSASQILFFCNAWLTRSLLRVAYLQKKTYNEWLICRKRPIFSCSLAEKDLQSVAHNLLLKMIRLLCKRAL